MLEHIQEILTDRILNHNPYRNRPRNITNAEYKIIENLKENNSIVIKKADKGSNIVILDRNYYIKEATRQLSDKKFYKECTKDLTLEHQSTIQELILQMFDKKIISEQTYKFLSEGGKRTSIFYLLPKIHKNLVEPPGRPIVSSIDSPTERISMMLDIILQPLLTGTKSYIKDTPDFLRKVDRITILPTENFFYLRCHKSLHKHSIRRKSGHHGKGILSKNQLWYPYKMPKKNVRISPKVQQLQV